MTAAFDAQDVEAGLSESSKKLKARPEEPYSCRDGYALYSELQILCAGAPSYFETELDGLASALHNLIERSRMCRLRDFLL